MKHTQIIRIPAAVLLAAAVLLLAGQSPADTVKLKDGKTYEGVITFEAKDMLKIRVQKSATISETITIIKTDVAEIIKSAPDDVAWAKMQDLLPTPSLVTTSGYRSMIERGPLAFLNAYPDSKHRPKVEELKKELDAELAKVDSGHIKIEGEWISPKSQQDFRQLIDARRLNLGMRQKAHSGNFIGALRDFERLEEVYYGTPSYVESIKYTLQLLPPVGQRLERMLADVEYVQKQFQEDVMKMPEAKRQQVIDARNREEDALKKRYEADKAMGLKWYQVNQRDKGDLTAYIQLVAGEIERLRGIDLLALEEQAKQLVKVDELLAEDKLEAAKELMRETTGSSGKGRSGSGSGGKYKDGYGNYRKSSGSGSNAKTSYIIALREKIQAKDAALAAAKAQAADSADGAEATGVIRREGATEVASTGDVPGTGEAETGENVEPAVEEEGGGLADLLAPAKPAVEKEPKKTSKPKSKKPSSKKKSNDKEDKPKPKVASSSGGFKWSFQKIIIGVALLLGLTVGLMKILGIGGAKT